MKTTINKKYNFKTIRPEKGMVLTSWEEGTSIEEYSSATEICAPMTFDESTLREISIEEDERLKKEQYEIFMAKEEKNNR